MTLTDSERALLERALRMYEANLAAASDVPGVQSAPIHSEMTNSLALRMRLDADEERRRP